MKTTIIIIMLKVLPIGQFQFLSVIWSPIISFPFNYCLLLCCFILPAEESWNSVLAVSSPA